VANILCIASPGDTALQLGAYWMQRYADYASSLGHNVVYQKTPTLPVLYKALMDFDPQLVVANGHGGAKSLRVGENNILIGVKGTDPVTHRVIHASDVDWFRGRIVLMLTCNTGVDVVPALVKAGAVAAMGYKKPYVFLTDTNASLGSDPVSKPFFETLFQPAIQMADGATFQQAIEMTRESFRQYAKTVDDKESEQYLRFNQKNLVALGNPNVKI
jgi:hypothetical protein